MKYFFILLAFLCSNQSGSAQSDASTIQKEQNIYHFTRILGFLKYWHPHISQKERDWDSIFFKYIDSIKNENQQQFNMTMVALLDRYPIKKEKIQPACASSLNWLTEDSTIGHVLAGRLQEIYNYRNVRSSIFAKQYPVGIINAGAEKKYKGAVKSLPDERMRLLILARFWNCIEYFYPYKDLMDKTWDSALITLIPKFSEASNLRELNMALLELTAWVQDGHVGYADFESDVYNYFFGYMWLPNDLQVINGRVFVDDKQYRNYFDPYGVESPLIYGDEIIKMDGYSLDSLMDSYRKYISVSNQNAFYYEMQYYIGRSTSKYPKLTVIRNKDTLHLNVSTIWGSVWYKMREKKAESTQYNKISDSVIYINFSTLQRRSQKEVLKEIPKYKYLIFDIQDYPNGPSWRLAGKLAGEKSVDKITFSKFDYSCPGSFKKGKNNNKVYKGHYFTSDQRIIVLVGERTQSAAEYIVMKLQALPNVTVVGTQTAGADGNVASLVLPGNITTSFSGIGVSYSDGTPAQRKGVKIDIDLGKLSELEQLKDGFILDWTIRRIQIGW